MDIDFEEKMSLKTNEELRQYIDSGIKYEQVAVTAAINELNKRGITVAEEEVANLEQELQERDTKSPWWENQFLRNLRINVVSDPAAPEYYSRKAIYFVSVFFGVFGGSILMAFNLKRTETKKGVWMVLLFGLSYSAAQIWIFSMLNLPNGFVLLFNIASYYMLNHFFWKKFIGEDTKYRTRPIWVPLVICIFFSILVIAATIAGSGH